MSLDFCPEPGAKLQLRPAMGIPSRCEVAVVWAGDWTKWHPKGLSNLNYSLIISLPAPTPIRQKNHISEFALFFWICLFFLGCCHTNSALKLIFLLGCSADGTCRDSWVSWGFAETTYFSHSDYQSFVFNGWTAPFVNLVWGT